MRRGRAARRAAPRESLRAPPATARDISRPARNRSRSSQSIACRPRGTRPPAYESCAAIPFSKKFATWRALSLVQTALELQWKDGRAHHRGNRTGGADSAFRSEEKLLTELRAQAANQFGREVGNDHSFGHDEFAA